MSLTLDPELAEEVTQEAFYKAFLKLETLKDKESSIHGFVQLL